MKYAVALLLTGCYATTPPPMNCDPVVVRCNPAEYPPLFAILPPWPFPTLAGVQEAPKPSPDSAGKRWLEKVAK